MEQKCYKQSDVGNQLLIDSFDGENRFLSNFFLCESLFYDDREWLTAEHAYQAKKTLDYSVQEMIRFLPTPGKAKRAGNQVELRSDWDVVKLFIMEDILRAKFSDLNLRRMLVETYPRVLIEGNRWGDFYWGVCNGKGENHLGKLLMKLRDEWR